MSLYFLPNGAGPTTAILPGVATTTTLLTLLQVKPFNIARVVEWGATWDGHASNTKLEFELIEVDVAATVTASVDADVTKLGPGVGDQAAASVAGLTLATSATGYTASAEGTITAGRLLDLPMFCLGSQAGSFMKQFPLGREPVIQIAKFGRIRVKAAGNAVNAKVYMVVDI